MSVQSSLRLNQIPPYLFATIAQKKQEMLSKGIDIIDLGIGDPDLPTDVMIVESLKSAAEDPLNHRYDESPRGFKSFLKAAVDWHARNFGTELDAESEVMQLIGSKEGLAHLAWAFVDPGDYVICPEPSYPVYRVNTLMAGGKLFEPPLLSKNGFLPCLEDIPTEVAKRAKLFYVCYPHNPTGAVASLGFFHDLVAFCREHQILLVNDMAYAAITYGDYRAPSVLQIPGAKDISVEFHSLSKTYNMAGWRLGFALGNSDALNALQKLKSNIDSKQFPAIAEAGAYALNYVSSLPVLNLYKKRRDILCHGLQSMGWDVQAPNATFYIWAPVPDLSLTSSEFSQRLLEEAHVLTIPGSSYGPSGEGFVRMAVTLAGDMGGERFKEAILRIQRSGLIPSKVML